MSGMRTLAAFVFTACLVTKALGEQVDNPAYAAWAKYKPGTTVTFKRETSGEGRGIPGGAEMTVAQKLVDVKPDAVTLEVTPTLSMRGRSTIMPGGKSVIPAKIDKDKEDLPAEGVPPGAQVTESKEGKETVEVKGKQVEAATRDLTITAPKPAAAGGGVITMKVKTWNSPEIPGGMFKSEMNTVGEAREVKNSLTLIDYSVAK